ncbi:MAG: 2-aminoethylphosphonate--pyruvate transaminase [Acetobacteraceae bacterium]|nr:2-aminoethylphosphonate--pyruvate transaminase [Acetobacteraceae bacterium]
MLLLIPGPVTTRPEVREALCVDIAPWDPASRDFYARLCARVLALAGGRDGVHAALPLPGCGHFIIEAAIRTFLAPGEALLVPMTGAYSERMTRLAVEAGRRVVPLPIPDDRPAAPSAVAAALAADPTIGHVGMVYSETGTGICHDLPTIGAAVRQAGRRMIVDAVSAFGALPFDIARHPEVDAAVFTANKCLEGVPGIAFAVARVDRLEESAGNAGSWSLDLTDVYAHQVENWGTARFTPPAQVLNAFDRALDLYETEGGQPARLARYEANMRTLYDGVRRLGLSPYLAEDAQGPIIVNVHAPADPAWNLQVFVDALKRRGFLISNFHNTLRPSFRVGCIGAIAPADMARAVSAMGQVLEEMGIRRREAA